MSAVAIAWLASSVGAALFVAAGYLAGSARQRPLAMELAPDSAEPGAQDLLDEARAQQRAVELEAQRLRQENAQLRLNLTTAAPAAAPIQPAGDDHAELRREQERSRTERARLTAERDEMARRRDRLEADARKHERERDELTAELGRVREELRVAAAGRIDPHALDQIESEKRDLLLKLQVAEGRAAEAARLLDENANLRRAAGESAEMRRQLAEAQSQLTQFRALKFSKEDRSLAQVVPLPRSTIAGDKSAALHAVLESLSAGSDVRSLVLADGMGLPVAGLGDHVEALAALAGVATGFIAKAQELLPLASARRMTVIDVNEMALTLVPDPSGASELCLVALSGAAGAKLTEASRALVDIAQIVQ